MVSPEDDTEFKLCDFGLACIAGDDQVLRCGSPGYVAPEILMKKYIIIKLIFLVQGLYCILYCQAVPHFMVKLLMKYSLRIKNDVCNFMKNIGDRFQKMGLIWSLGSLTLIQILEFQLIVHLGIPGFILRINQYLC